MKQIRKRIHKTNEIKCEIFFQVEWEVILAYVNFAKKGEQIYHLNNSNCWVKKYVVFRNE